MKSRDLALAARAYAADLGAGMVRQMDSKGIKVVAVGAALALVLGLGAGFVGRAPIDRALHPHPMTPVPGTSQIATATPPLTAAPSPQPAARAIVAQRDDTPIVATGDDPPADSQTAQSDETEVAAPVAAPTPDDGQPPVTRPPRHGTFPQNYRRFGEAPPDYPPPWAFQGPPRWAPPPPPGYGPD